MKYIVMDNQGKEKTFTVVEGSLVDQDGVVVASNTNFHDTGQTEGSLLIKTPYTKSSIYIIKEVIN